jgi:adenine-specific DNA-methyltransferase
MKNIKTFRKDHDYVIVAFKNEQLLNKIKEKPQFKYDYNNPDNDPRGPYKAGSISRREEASDPNHPRYYTVISPSGKKFTRQWDISKEEFEILDKDGRIYWGKEGNSVPALKIFLNEEREITPYSILIEKGTNTEAKEEFLNILGDEFENIINKLNPKPEKLITTLGQLATNNESIMLDFFAGSGTTAHSVMKLNNKYGGQRKFILIEMADYFDEVIIPRLKKICYSFNWKDGKPQDAEGISQIIKYHYLEQYEDTLHNIEFPNEEKGQKVLQLFDEDKEVNEYVMKYMLKFETEGSPTLLNLNSFENPFEYKLKIISSLPAEATAQAGGKGEKLANVDLVETFNYLLGLKISGYRFLNKNACLRAGTHRQGRKYVVVLGERDNRRTAIIWRPTKDIDLKKDKEIIDKVLNGFNPDEIFINGDSFVKGYKLIESEFKILMNS